MGDFVLSARGVESKTKSHLNDMLVLKLDEHGLDFKVVTDEDIAGAGEGCNRNNNTIRCRR